MFLEIATTRMRIKLSDFVNVNHGQWKLLALIACAGEAKVLTILFSINHCDKDKIFRQCRQGMIYIFFKSISMKGTQINSTFFLSDNL